jgi:aspartyl/asparaginyl beta-hydroxylase (cupin superfamily)
MGRVIRLNQTEAEKLARAGAAALQQGRAAEARESFERLIAAGQVNAQIRLLLAVSCRALGDHAAQEEALDAVLQEDTRNLHALLMKGDCRQAAGDDRAASSFYGTAIRIARQLPSLPSDLKAEVERAEAVSRDNAGRFRARLEGHLAAVPQSDRFRESLQLMFGEKEIFLPKPSAYYFPRLPVVQFYERSDFAWAGTLEAAAGDMRAELDAVLEEDGLFRPYLEASKDRPNYDFHGMLGNPAWSTLDLFENGAPVAKNVARCPKTFAAVNEAPLCHITTRAPSILFSLLRPGARIAPHHGMINTRLICHLPLIVPEGCGFRVGNEVRQWEEGRLLIFDDTIEHEAWNESDHVRVILIFDVWNPHLSEAERELVSAMMTAKNAWMAAERQA